MRHVRWLLLIGCALALVLGPAGSALADTSPTPQAFACLGKIVATDQTAGTITVMVKRASTALQGSIGQSLTLTVTSDSVLTAVSRSPKLPVALADVPVGDMLAVRGTIVPGSDPAVCDITRASLWKPSFRARFLCLGTVSSVDLQAGALAVHVDRGYGVRDIVGGRTITVSSQTRIVILHGRAASAGTLGQITAGDRVCVAGRADRTNADVPVFVAGYVAVRHVVPIARLTWFACCGRVTAIDAVQGTVTLDVAQGTRAVAVGSPLTLTGNSASGIRTLRGGVLATLSIADVPIGDAIVVAGTIDHGDPNATVYDIGHAFVWLPAK